MLDSSLDPLQLVEAIENRYRELWAELTGVDASAAMLERARLALPGARFEHGSTGARRCRPNPCCWA